MKRHKLLPLNTTVNEVVLCRVPRWALASTSLNPKNNVELGHYTDLHTVRALFLNPHLALFTTVFT